MKQADAVLSRNDIRAVSDFFSTSGQLLGCSADLNQIRYLPIADGRWLNEPDDTQKRAVIVLGDEADGLLFPGRPSVGSTILLNGIRFEVVEFCSASAMATTTISTCGFLFPTTPCGNIFRR